MISKEKITTAYQQGYSDAMGQNTKNESMQADKIFDPSTDAGFKEGVQFCTKILRQVSDGEQSPIDPIGIYVTDCFMTELNIMRRKNNINPSEKMAEEQTKKVIEENNLETAEIILKLIQDSEEISYNVKEGINKVLDLLVDR